MSTVTKARVSANYLDRDSSDRWLINIDEKIDVFPYVECKGEVSFVESDKIEERGFGCRIVAITEEVEGRSKQPEELDISNLIPLKFHFDRITPIWNKYTKVVKVQDLYLLSNGKIMTTNILNTRRID